MCRNGRRIVGTAPIAAHRLTARLGYPGTVIAAGLFAAGRGPTKIRGASAQRPADSATAPSGSPGLASPTSASVSPGRFLRLEISSWETCRFRVKTGKAQNEHMLSESSACVASIA